jgi:hypothetical protein
VQVPLALLDHVLLDLLAVLAGAGQPRGDGTLIQTKAARSPGRTAMAEQGQHGGHHVAVRKR